MTLTASNPFGRRRLRWCTETKWLARLLTEGSSGSREQWPLTAGGVGGTRSILVFDRARRDGEEGTVAGVAEAEARMH